VGGVVLFFSKEKSSKASNKEKFHKKI